MMRQERDLLWGARKLVRTCASVRPEEKVLVVTDTAIAQRIADAVYRAAVETGAITSKLVMEPGGEPGVEVSEVVAAAMRASDVVFGLTTTSLYHTQARLQACAAGARVVAGTEITEDILVEGA